MQKMAWMGVALLVTLTAGAEEPTGPWSGSLGLSYIATSGNSDTSSLGIEATVKCKPDPWGIEINALVFRAEKDGDKTADRGYGHARGQRALSGSWDVFLGASAERDRFAGIDLRAIAEAGATYKALTGPEHELSFDAGATFTKEERLNAKDRTFAGALAGVSYVYILGEGAKISERLMFLPNFDETDDWRLTSETAAQAAFSRRFALKLAFFLRYDHVPPPGFSGTDTTTTASVVWSF
jgi:putative salt-induced outer membrane protein